MKTHCNSKTIKVKKLGKRNVEAGFSGGTITSDAGAILLDQADQAIKLLDRFAACFCDHRDSDLIEHTVPELVRQRVFGLALGYEDLNDHDELSLDPLLATVVGKVDPTGMNRRNAQDKGRPLAGKSTLNRLELTEENVDPDERYKKISLDFKLVERLFVDAFLEAYEEPPDEIVLDFDATDTPLHGKQEGRFFHGYYDEYCYLPLYVFCSDHLLVAKLRKANIDACEGTVEVLAWLVPHIRARWPKVRIIVRGDSGFARENIMFWCENNRVDYVLGLAKNDRLIAAISDELDRAKALWQTTGRPSRVYRDFPHSTLKSWSRERRVVGKAEHLSKGPNPRFIVTSLSMNHYSTVALYERLYCARGEMENRIKEQQLYLFADKTSTHKIRANQVRLWFSSVAYTLVNALRRLALAGTELERARCDTIRLKLFKIGALIMVSVRRVWISMAGSFPRQRLFRLALSRLREVLRKPQVIPMRC